MRKFILFSFSLFYIFSFGYNIRQITNKDGLSNSAVLSICQDKEGYMWLGTVDGLNIFDGTIINVYKSTTKQNSLSGNLIENILETEKGVFWIRTNYGLNKLNNIKKQVEYFPEFNGYFLLEKDGNNNVFIVKNDGVVYYYTEQLHNFRKIAVPRVKLNDIADCVIKNNILTLIYKSGKIISYSIIYLKNGEINLSLSKVDSVNQKILFCSHDIKDNTVLFVDDSRTLFQYDLIQKKKDYIFNINAEISDRGEISSIVKQKNNYYIGFKTNGLICLFNTPDKKDRFDVKNINISSGVFSLYKDNNQDILWVGTDGQGVFLIYNTDYSIHPVSFNDIPFKIEKPVRALLLDKENTLWVGTKGDGILRINNLSNGSELDYTNTFHLTSKHSELKSNSVYSFSKSLRNILWIGHEEGISYYSYKDKRIKNMSLLYDGEPIKYIHSIYELNDSTLWLASVGMGMIVVHVSGNTDSPVVKSVKKIVYQNNQFAYNNFFAIFAESDSILWFGNRGYGIFKINAKNNQYKTIVLGKKSNEQLLNDVFALNQDEKGNIWAGTSLGLVKYSTKGTISIFNEEDGFPNNTVHGILKDSNKNLWLSTNKGIIRFDIQKNTFQTYNENNGLVVTEFSDGAFYRDEQSKKMYFGGVDGFVVINETNEKSNAYVPALHLNSLSILGKDYNIYDFYLNRQGKHILNLNYNQNFFTITFTANDYIDGNNYNYFYKLDGYNNEWINNKNSKSISFTNLTPGEYLLYVKYRNNVTGEESSVFPIKLIIRPPWYLSTIAYIVYIFLIMSCVVLLSLYLIWKNDQKRKIALEKIKQKHQEEVYESKLRFFTNIAHEFSTPLTLIYGPCSRILSHKGADSFVLQYTKLIERNAERLNNLIQQLIEFRQIETGNRQPQIETIPISDLFTDIVKLFSEVIDSKGVKLNSNIQPKLFWNSDKTFFYSIVSNLISNALRYTDKNGTIKVTAKATESTLHIIISNTGKGIKEENFERIFDRYSVLDSFENQEKNTDDFSYSGLGLAITNNLVHLLGGKIEVKSILNEDTTFIVELPKQKTSNLVINNKSNLPDLLQRKEYTTQMILPEYKYVQGKQTILILEEDVEILWLVCEVFAESYNVMPRNNIADTEDLFADIYPDIIICDVFINKGKGILLTRKIKSNKKTAHIPIILLSAKHDVDEEIVGLNAGAEIYISKPFNVEHLKISVKRLISRKEELKSYFSSPLSAFDLIEGKLTHVEDKVFFEKVLDVINENIKNEFLSAAFVADAMKISTRHLFRKLHKISGKSVVEMIKECRIYTAQNLLLNTKMTIDEVMYNSGFYNRTTFYKNFTNKFNCTPKEYRDSGIQNIEE
ncbi:MAG: two-component regulator propeller domain-containing protein [Paludibacter sp.]|nr:two-component regulator propeller domain-containing protein [Paludibacter sp.]